jgi:transcriptional regulator with XRE-family HTH domain
MISVDSTQWFENLGERSADDPAYVAESLALDVVVELGRAMRGQSISQSELARRIGTTPAFVSQTLHGRPNMTFLTLAKFALALGLECSVSLTPRAAVEPPQGSSGGPCSAPLSKAPAKPGAELGQKATKTVPVAG